MAKLTQNWISLKNQSYKEGKKNQKIPLPLCVFSKDCIIPCIGSDHYWEPEDIIFFFLFYFGKKYLEIDKRVNLFYNVI